MDVTDYYPFRIAITKDLYQTYIGFFEIVKKTDWEIVLHSSAPETIINSAELYDQIIY